MFARDCSNLAEAEKKQNSDFTVIPSYVEIECETIISVWYGATE